LLIVDPTTKQVVNAEAANKAESSKESITKSSTQPSISTINQNSTPSSVTQPTVAASASISGISSTVNSPSTLKTDTPANNVPSNASTSSSSSQSSTTVVSGAVSKPDTANQVKIF